MLHKPHHVETVAERRTKIRKFLSQFIGDDSLADDENFFETGLINSIVALDLLQFLEKLFSVTVPMEELRIENFSTVTAIIQLMTSLSPEQPASE